MTTSTSTTTSVAPSVAGLGSASVGTNGAGGVTISGLASGLNDSQLVTELVAADGAQLTSYQSDLSNAQAAVTTISNIGTALSGLSTAIGSLSTLSAVSGYTATSSSSAASATAAAGAVPGNFQFTVQSLATAQQTLSAPMASATTALGAANGSSIKIQVGSGAPTTINIGSTDTLTTLAQKINASGAAVSASVFYDGSQYRLEVSGVATGASNALTFTENGTNLDLNGSEGLGKTLQTASNAQITLGTTVNGVFSGIPITSTSNQITSAIPGVTLTLNQTTAATDPVNVSVAPSVNTLSTNLQSFVNAYNTVISQIQTAAGYGNQKASNPLLSGDSALRSITQSLTQTLNGIYGTGNYQTLATIGLSLSDTGMLSLDTAALSNAFQSDPNAVESLLAPSPTHLEGGAMTAFQSVMFGFTDPTIGPIATETNHYNQLVTQDQNSIATQQDMLNQYQAQLQQAFSSMETTYADSKSLSSQLTQQLG